MIPVRKLVSSVCTAVKELGESKGTSVQDITAYIRDIIHGKNVSAISVRKAIKTAIENQLLRETNMGKFKLNSSSGKSSAGNKTERLTDDLEVLMSKCGKKKRTICKGRNSKRPKKRKCRRSCTPIWVPKKKRGCRRKRKSSCKRRRSSCPRRRRRSSCPRRRRRTCPKRRRKSSCPKRRRRSSCPKRRRRSCVRRCEDPGAQLGFQEAQGISDANEQSKTQANNQ